MDKINSGQLLNIINNILWDYASTCGVEPFNGKVIIADNMADSYKKIRNDLVEKGKINLNEVNKYHGLTIQPLKNDGKFTILLNSEYVLETLNQNNVDWIGTLVHEATHVNDFKDYFRIIQPKSYDELCEYALHRIFLYWTEFHAKAIGYYFLRKYALENFKAASHIDYILNTEIPFHIDYLVQEVGATQDVDRQMYIIAHFLSRIAVWQYLYPEAFNLDFICELMNSNPWMKDLYEVFVNYKSLDEIYPHFDEVEEIIMNHYFGS